MNDIEPLEIGNPEAIVKEEAASIVLEARAMVVKDEESHRAVDGFIRRIKALRAKADSIFDDSITKAKAALEAARALKSIVTDPLDEAEKLARGKQRSYLTVLETKRLEEERKVREELARQREIERKAEAQGEAAPLFRPLAPVPAKVSAEPLRKTWKCDIVDETKAPPQFLMVDKKKVDEYARTMKDKAQETVDPEGKWVRFYFVVDSVVKG